MKGQNIVMVALQSWDFEIGSNARNIATEFARNNRVLYVNPPIDTITRYRGDAKKNQKYLDVLSGAKPAVSKVADNIWNLTPDFVSTSINWIPLAPVYDALNKSNNRKFAASIKKAANELGFQTFALFNDNLMAGGLYLKEFLNPTHYIYYIRDYLLVQPYFRKHGVRTEPEIIRKSDLVVANSTYLQEYSAQYNKKSYYVGQGCEVEMFDNALIKSRPADMAKIKGPVVGYVGTLTSMRLDINLLEAISKKRPDWSIVLVGPEDDAFKASSLHQLSNVHFLGKKTPAELPEYVHAFDVCINPQALNQLTIGNYPRKIDEYLAMGKPTVATATKAMEIFQDYVYLAENADGYITGIEKALSEKDQSLVDKRIALARSHTWENSVKEIYNSIKLSGTL